MLAVRDLACVRGGRTLFAGLSFAPETGGAALVTGPNGAGKSSLIRILAGLLPAASGEVVRDETRVALMTEAAAFDGERRLGEALAFWARLDRVPDPARAGRGGAGGCRAGGAGGGAGAAAVDRAAAARGDRSGGGVGGGAVAARRAGEWLDAAAVARLEALVTRHRAAGGVAVVATHLPMVLPRRWGLRWGIRHDPYAVTPAWFRGPPGRESNAYKFCGTVDAGTSGFPPK